MQRAGVSYRSISRRRFSCWGRRDATSSATLLPHFAGHRALTGEGSLPCPSGQRMMAPSPWMRPAEEASAAAVRMVLWWSQCPASMVPLGGLWSVTSSRTWKRRIVENCTRFRSVNSSFNCHCIEFHHRSWLVLALSIILMSGLDTFCKFVIRLTVCKNNSF